MKSIAKLWAFNPGHEEALLYAHKATYTPSNTIIKMRYELAHLMLFIASDEDYVYCPSPDGRSAEIIDYNGQKVNDLSTLPPLELMLWGLEPHSHRQIVDWAHSKNLILQTSHISTQYYTLAHRSSSHRYLQHLQKHYPALLPSPDIIPHRLLIEQHGANKIAAEIQAQGYKQVIIKRPYSSSGRGVMPYALPFGVQQEALFASLIKHYGEISLEPLLRRVQDYALLFWADALGVQHIGYSKFITDNKSGTAYSGSVLLADKYIAQEIEYVLGSRELLHELIQITQDYLHNELKGTYKGYIGIDMMSYRDLDGRLCLHPCVEINVRGTMGVIAHCIRKKLAVPDSSLFKLGLSSNISQETQEVQVLAAGQSTDTFAAYLLHRRKHDV